MVSIELCKPIKGLYIPPKNLKDVSKEEIDNDMINLSNDEWNMKYSAHWSEGVDDSIPLVIKKKYNKKTIQSIKEIKNIWQDYIFKIDANTICLPYERTLRTILDINTIDDVYISNNIVQINRILDNVIGDEEIKREVNNEFKDGLILYIH